MKIPEIVFTSSHAAEAWRLSHISIRELLLAIVPLPLSRAHPTWLLPSGLARR